jgi:E3 SUMO-protein ligase PIAS1
MLSSISPCFTVISDVASQQIRHAVKQNTVDKLKQIITGLNDECGTSLPKSGKKQDIIDRIGFQLDHWRAARMEDKWLKAKNILSQVRSYGR